MRLLNKKDFYIITPLIVLSIIAIVVVYLFSGDSKKALIFYEDKEVMQIDLNTTSNKTFSVQEVPNVVFKIENNSISFNESDCPDKICIKSGKLSKVSQIAACVPNKLFIVVTSNNDSKNDADVVLG